MGLLNKVTRFARSPEGRRAVDGLTNRGAGRRGRGTSGARRGQAGTGGGGALGKLAGSLFGRR